MYSISKIKLQMIKENTLDYNSNITSPYDILKFINTHEKYEQCTEENLILIVLNNKNSVISYTELSKGSVNAAVADIPTIFKYVLTCNGNKFILAHNHPSGDVTPSDDDIRVTRRVKEASKIMGIDFLDHIIIADGTLNSIIKEGQI